MRRVVLSLLLLVVLTVPSFSYAAIVPCDGPDCQACQLGQLATNFLNWLLGIAASLVIIAIIYSGFTYVVSVGNVSRRVKATKILYNAVIGFAITLLAWFVIETVFKSLASDALTNPFEKLECVAQPVSSTSIGDISTPGSIAVVPSQSGTNAPTGAILLPTTGSIMDIIAATQVQTTDSVAGGSGSTSTKSAVETFLERIAQKNTSGSSSGYVPPVFDLTSPWAVSPVDDGSVSLDGGSAGATASLSGAVGNSDRPFSSSSQWNLPIGSGAQLAGSGDAAVQQIRSYNGATYSGVAMNNTNWSIPVYYASASDPLRSVYVSMPGFPSGSVSVRIPNGARQSPGLDAHFAVVDPDGKTVHEFYQMNVDSWTATAYTPVSLSGSGLGVMNGFDASGFTVSGMLGWGSTRAYGGSQIGGLIRSGELASGVINHALAVAAPRGGLTSPWVYPATRDDYYESYPNRGSTAVKVGMLITIPQSVNLSGMGLSKETYAVAKALQDYGAIIVDMCDGWCLYMEQTHASESNAVDMGKISSIWSQYATIVTNNTASNPKGGGTPVASVSAGSSATNAGTVGTTNGIAVRVGDTIEFYGDSTTWGLAPDGTGNQVSSPEPLAFSRALNSQYTIKNEGVSGTRADQLLAGTDGKHPAFSTQMKNSSAAGIFINFAINDSWQVTDAVYESSMRQLIQTAKNAGKWVILETPNPISGNLDAENAIIKKLANEFNIPVIDKYTMLMNYLGGKSVLTICPDGTHPSNSIYQIIGEYTASQFKALIAGTTSSNTSQTTKSSSAGTTSTNTSGTSNSLCTAAASDSKLMAAMNAIDPFWYVQCTISETSVTTTSGGSVTSSGSTSSGSGSVSSSGTALSFEKGFYLYSRAVPKASRDSWVKYLKGLGANLFYVAIDDLGNWLDIAKQNDVKIIAQLDGAYLVDSNWQTKLSQAKTLLANWYNHPNLHSVSVREEPNNTLMPALDSYYGGLKAAFPSLKIQLIHNQHNTANYTFKNKPDYVGTDRYAFWGWDTSSGGYSATPASALGWLENELGFFEATLGDGFQIALNINRLVQLIPPSSIESYGDVARIDGLVAQKSQGWAKVGSNYKMTKYYSTPKNYLQAQVWLSILYGAGSVLFWDGSIPEEGMKNLYKNGFVAANSSEATMLNRSELILGGLADDITVQEIKKVFTDLEKYADTIKNMVPTSPVVKNGNLRSRTFTVNGKTVTLTVNLDVGTWSSNSVPYLWSRTDYYPISMDGYLEQYVPKSNPVFTFEGAVQVPGSTGSVTNGTSGSGTNTSTNTKTTSSTGGLSGSSNSLCTAAASDSKLMAAMNAIDPFWYLPCSMPQATTVAGSSPGSSGSTSSGTSGSVSPIDTSKLLYAIDPNNIFADGSIGTNRDGLLEIVNLNQYSGSIGNMHLQYVGRSGSGNPSGIGSATGFGGYGDSYDRLRVMTDPFGSGRNILRFRLRASDHLWWDSSASRRLEIQPGSSGLFMKQGGTYKIALGMTRPKNDTWTTSSANDIILFQIHEDGTGSPPITLSITPGGTVYTTRRTTADAITVDGSWQASGTTVPDFYIIDVTLAQSSGQGKPYFKVQRASGNGALQTVAESSGYNNYTTSGSALFYPKFGYYAWYGSSQLGSTPTEGLVYDHYGLYIADMSKTTNITDADLLAMMRGK